MVSDMRMTTSERMTRYTRFAHANLFPEFHPPRHTTYPERFTAVPAYLGTRHKKGLVFFTCLYSFFFTENRSLMVIPPSPACFVRSGSFLSCVAAAGVDSSNYAVELAWSYFYFASCTHFAIHHDSFSALVSYCPFYNLES